MVSTTTLGQGSSPLTRGKQVLSLDVTGGKGLIPAHAGKTPGDRTRLYTHRAHPRSRGENTGRGRVCRRASGSSPLTRGKRRNRRANTRRERLIPAHAGKTGTPSGRAYPPLAHPRSRGENFTLTVQTRRPAGSSPLTRGKLHATPQTDDIPGLIPAHAGKTPRHP